MYDVAREWNMLSVSVKALLFFVNTILHMTLDYQECKERAQLGMKENNYCTVNSMPQRQTDIQTEIYQINGPIQNETF